MTSSKRVHEYIVKHPQPGNDPVERLRHVVEVFHDVDDADMAITATSNIYGDGVKTGLTWGDLAAILAKLDTAQPTE